MKELGRRLSSFAPRSWPPQLTLVLIAAIAVLAAMTWLASRGLDQLKTDTAARDGHELPILDSGAPIQDGKELIGVVIVFRDRFGQVMIKAGTLRGSFVFLLSPNLSIWRCLNLSFCRRAASAMNARRVSFS